MSIQSFKVYEGTMTLGTDPDDVDCASQVQSVAVVPSEKVKETDAEPVLSGEELEGSSSATLTYRLKGRFVQDAGAAGVVAFTWEHAGEEVAFTVTPATGDSPTVAGTVRIVPVQIGGDVSKTDKAKSDFDWLIIGTPTPTWDASPS